MAYKRYRPDLLNRIQTRIDNGKIPKRIFTAKDLGEQLGAPAHQVLECLIFLTSLGYVHPIKRSIGGKHKFKKRSSNKSQKPQSPEEILYEIPWERWHPSEEDYVPRSLNAKKCPVCGKPIKRRHLRGEFHDPDKCQLDNVKDIMTR